MKVKTIAVVIVATYAQEEDHEIYARHRRSNPFLPRKMVQLSTMFQHRHGYDNYLKTYGYGCYCLNLGEKPMTGLVRGVEPVDNMDRHCMRYTQCIKCLKIDHGDHCQPENIQYEYSYNADKTEIQCDNPTDTCRHNLCQCDKMLVERFDDKFEFHQSENHIFGGFDFETMCEARVPDGNGGLDRHAECCGEYPDRKAFMAGGAKDKVCCAKLTPNIPIERATCDATPEL